MAIYFGGSRSLPRSYPILGAVVRAVQASGQQVHVGCQLGADRMVTLVALAQASSLVVFAVAPTLPQAPWHVQQAAARGARVVLGAGGSSAPMPARFLLRSIAAAQGCSAAVFFSPGQGSLAVMAQLPQSMPLFAFAAQAPGPVPGQAGQWSPSSFYGLACWQWSSAQLSLF